LALPLAQYCITCHNARTKSGNLLLDKADAEQVFNSSETWEKVVVKLRARAMPPPGRPRPDNATYDAVAAWLETELDRAAGAHPNPGRPANLHRLNRTEYANAVHDLFGIAIDSAEMLPPDEQAFGFDTNADALSVAPALLEGEARIARELPKHPEDATLLQAKARADLLEWSYGPAISALDRARKVQPDSPSLMTA